MAWGVYAAVGMEALEAMTSDLGIYRSLRSVKDVMFVEFPLSLLREAASKARVCRLRADFNPFALCRYYYFPIITN